MHVLCVCIRGLRPCNGEAAGTPTPVSRRTVKHDCDWVHLALLEADSPHLVGALILFLPPAQAAVIVQAEGVVPLRRCPHIYE